MDMKELKTLLETFKTDVQKSIDEKITKVESQGDTVTEEITELKAKLAEVDEGLKTIQEQEGKSFGLPGVETEKDRFSWAKFYVGLANEFKANRGLISVSEAKNFWDKEGSFEQRVCKDYAADSGQTGSFIVPPQIYQGDVIDVVYANTAMLKMPSILKLEGLKGDLPIPCDNGHLSAYHLGETEAPTKSSATFSLKKLTPKKIGVFVPVSNRLLDQTNNAIEMIVKNKMGLDASVELSRGLTEGKGTDSEGKGLFTYYSEMTGTGNIAANGARFTIDDLADMLMSLDNVNEYRDTNTYGAIMHPSVLWGMLREKAIMYSGQNQKNGMPKIPQLMLSKEDIQNAVGLQIEKTTQVSKYTLGTGGATSTKVVVGDMSKFVYASFRDPIFRVSDVASDASGNSAFLKDQLFMVMFLEYDCLCMRPAAFTGRGGAQTDKARW
jgi:HK97 family phage major capsid protein